MCKFTAFNKPNEPPKYNLPTPIPTYNEWRSSLKDPDDSIFYYHSDLDRILLGLAIFSISSIPLVRNLGKLKSLTLLHIYTKDLITAWIDEDDDSFKSMFGLTITIAEAYFPCIIAAEKQYPSRKKLLRKLVELYGTAISAGGDMAPSLAEILIDDLSTDGEKLYSDKIKKYGEELLALVKVHGMNIPPSLMNRLNNWQNI